MPRSKPKAQRLAPPLSNSISQFQTHAPPNTTDDNDWTGCIDSATALETVHKASEPNDDDEYHHEVKNPAKRQRYPSHREALAPSLSNPSRVDGGNAPVVFRGSLPAHTVVGTNSKSKKRRKTHDTTQCPASRREQSPTVDPSCQMFGLRNAVLDRHDDARRMPSDVGGPRSSQASCASTDTASVGLAEDIPQPEELEGMAHFPFENEIPDSYKHKHKQTLKRMSNGRVANNSFKQTRTRKSVEADPTPPSGPPVLGKLAGCSQVETVGRSERHKFSFLSDDEAKSVFDREGCKVNNGNARQCQRKEDKEKLRDYWKELETVSIRTSGQAEKGGGKSGHNGMKSRGNGAPSLHPFEDPITEENLDGGDAIPVDKPRKKKFAKKAKSGSGLIERGRDGEDTASSTGLSECDGQACMECGSHGKSSKMVLCDACSDGCHTFCMRPARTSVPLGVWVCPRCHMVAKKHEVHLSKLGVFVENQGARL